MLATKLKAKNRPVLTAAQSRLLKESLKQLLGNGLITNQPRRTKREEKLLFLKDALNSRILENEWIA